jgi:Bardet-Biedl syndrome 4 protein
LRDYRRLEDFENCCAAYEKAIELGEDYVTHLNYAITLYKNDEIERAKVQFDKFESIFCQLTEMGDVDSEVIQQAELLRVAIK